MTWGPGASRTVLESAAPATQKLADTFDAGSLYGDKKIIDQDHPNRIDGYGCLFSDCDSQGGGGLMTKVQSLKRQLAKLATLQQKFMGQLGQPVTSTIQVLPGEPGRLGFRGPRGLVGAKGDQGDQGAQGRTGLQGRPGIPGEEGVRGQKGGKGEVGDRGPTGAKGTRGPVGPRGLLGNEGPQGKRGPKGYTGANGPPGQQGGKGNRGPRGVSPVGPDGPAGIEGSRGPPGETGPKGDRGPVGPGGNSGPGGDAGIAGNRGPAGQDAKQMPPQQCFGAQTIAKESVCCGGGTGANPTYWQNLAQGGQFTNIDTSMCKFTDDSVKYFMTTESTGWTEWAYGQSSVLKPSKNGFEMRLREKYDHWGGHNFNGRSTNVRWCGVGRSSGPKVSNVCCGTSTWEDGESALIYDFKNCKITTKPWYMISMEVNANNLGQNTDNSNFWGYNEVRGGPWTNSARVYIKLQDSRSQYRTHMNANWGDKFWQSGMKMNFCYIGDSFPSGDMDLAAGRGGVSDYPCDGMRLLSNTDGPASNVVSDNGKMCCGETDPDAWRSVGGPYNAGGFLEVRVDTSACAFSMKPVFMVNIAGDSSHDLLTGTTAFEGASAKGFNYKVQHIHKAVNVQGAKAKKWRVQWCGVGTI